MLNKTGIMSIFEDFLNDFDTNNKFIIHINKYKELVIYNSEYFGNFKYQTYKYVNEILNEYPNMSFNFNIEDTNLFIFDKNIKNFKLEKHTEFKIKVIPKHKYLHIHQVTLLWCF